MAPGKDSDALAELDTMLARWPFDEKVKTLATVTPEYSARLDQIQLSKYKNIYGEAYLKMRKLGRDHEALMAVHGVRNQYTPLWQQMYDADRFIKLDTEARYAANDVMQAASGALEILEKDPAENASDIGTMKRGADEALSDYRAYEANIAKVIAEVARVRSEEAQKRNAN